MVTNRFKMALDVQNACNPSLEVINKARAAHEDELAARFGYRREYPEDAEPWLYECDGCGYLLDARVAAPAVHSPAWSSADGLPRVYCPVCIEYRAASEWAFDAEENGDAL